MDVGSIQAATSTGNTLWTRYVVDAPEGNPWKDCGSQKPETEGPALVVVGPTTQTSLALSALALPLVCLQGSI